VYSRISVATVLFKGFLSTQPKYEGNYFSLSWILLLVVTELASLCHLAKLDSGIFNGCIFKIATSIIVDFMEKFSLKVGLPRFTVSIVCHSKRLQSQKKKIKLKIEGKEIPTA